VYFINAPRAARQRCWPSGEANARWRNNAAHFTRSSKPLARLTSAQRLAADDFQEISMGDNAFLTPAFAILVIGIIAVVFWLVTRAKKRRNKK
jgi:hypothetical protein